MGPSLPRHFIAEKQEWDAEGILFHMWCSHSVKMSKYSNRDSSNSIHGLPQKKDKSKKKGYGSIHSYILQFYFIHVKLKKKTTQK